MEDKILPLPARNEVSLSCTAPDVPGEVKVTFRVDPLPDEVIQSNNEMSTYLTVAKGGLSVLLVDRLDRGQEPPLICDALRLDPRIRLYVVQVPGEGTTSEPPATDLFRFDQRRYDVIILGDVTANQLRAL